MNKTIKISDDFSKFPSGRYKTDGKFTGEHFREDYILPALKEFETVIIDLNDVRGYGSSFLEEAFGGIVRNGFFTEQELKTRLKITGGDNCKTYITEIWGYVEGAQNELVE